jgi:hypothetical protein
MGGSGNTMRETRTVYNILNGEHDGQRPLGRPYIDRSIVLKWILETQDVSNSGQRSVVSSWEHGNEHSDSIKDKESLDQLNDYWFSSTDTN